MEHSLFVNGTKNLRIDHPLAPTQKYLVHASMDSPEPLLVYSGNTTTDADRRAVVLLPAYVELINHDFRYQLTVVGQFAHAMVASEIHDHRFTIETDKPRVKVSWQVTGVRHDEVLRVHPYEAEPDKPMVDEIEPFF